MKKGIVYGCAFAFLMVAWGAVAEQAPSGLPGPVIAHWRFDVEDKGVSPDAGPSRLHAELKDGACLTDAPGGKALMLKKGATSYVQLPESTAFDLSSAFTLAAWICPAQRGQMDVFCLRTDTLDRGFRLRYFWGKAIFEVGVGQGKTVRVESTKNAIVPDVWAHVAATYDGAKLRLYVNAEPVAETAMPNKPVPYHGGKPVIGNYLARKDAYPFIGQIDDVVILASAINGDGIQQWAQQREP